MIPILKKDFIKDFYEYFPKSREMDENLKELEEDDFLEMKTIRPIKEDYEPWESLIRFKILIDDKYHYKSFTVKYNTSSIFALMLCGYDF